MGYDNSLKGLGYATGAYELFSDIHPEGHPGFNEFKEMPLKRNIFPGLYDKISAKKKDGTKYHNEFGTYVCPKAVREEMIKRVERELNIYPHETYFIDVYQANGLYECYDEKHTLSRQAYAEAILENLKLLQDRYGTYIGGEYGSDYAAAYGVYVHGMMTLQRTWFGSEIVQKDTIYYNGNWEDNERPSIMLSSHTASPTYLKYSINERLRVPLYELVYHDAVITSWRWEDGNHHAPEIWWKKDLFNILYGSAPLWSLDRENWSRYRETFKKSYGKMAPWLSEVMGQEMVSHRFISQDRQVQESLFDSGKRVIVNFSEETYDFDGNTVMPRDFLVL